MLKIVDATPGTRIKICGRSLQRGTITEVYDDPDPTIGKMFVIKFDSDPGDIRLAFNAWAKHLELVGETEETDVKN